jgi:hypothetical protein
MYVGPALGQLGEGQIVGAEIVSPLRDTVRLVDGEEGDRSRVEKTLGALARETLGGDVEHVELARDVRALDPGSLGGILRGVEEGRAHADSGQGIDLILHQGNQWRDDDAGTRTY